MNKRIITLCCCFVFATAIVIGLYAMSDHIVHKPNSFLREYRKFAATQSRMLDIQYNSWYIAGVTDEHVYLGNITAPLHLLVTNLILGDTQHIKLRFKKPTQKIYPKTRVLINSPYFYIADGTLPGLFRGNLGEWIADRFMYDSVFFRRIVPIRNSSFAIRTNTPPTLDNVLGKLQNDTPYIKIEPKLLEKQIDGVFCTEGELVYNHDLEKIIYSYAYRNGFIVYDTNLSINYRGHTIDTFTRAQIKVAEIKSSGTRNLVRKKYINKEICTSGVNLFIHSDLRARNDDERLFEVSSVIDVYDLERNVYEFSFSLPYIKNDFKLRDFMVLNNKTLFSLHDHYLIRWDLQSKYFNAK